MRSIYRYNLFPNIHTHVPDLCRLLDIQIRDGMVAAWFEVEIDEKTGIGYCKDLMTLLFDKDEIPEGFNYIKTLKNWHVYALERS